MDKLSVQPLADIGADGDSVLGEQLPIDSVTSTTAIQETVEQLIEQIDAFISPPSLNKKMEAVYPSLATPSVGGLPKALRPSQKEEFADRLAALEPSFYTRFPKFKMSPPLYRWVAATSKIAAHYEIKITFIWNEYDIPRFGILSYTAKPSFCTTWEVEFAPWNSEGKTAIEAINWTKLYYVDFFQPLRAIERILLDSFQNELPPQAKANDLLDK